MQTRGNATGKSCRKGNVKECIFDYIHCILNANSTKNTPPELTYCLTLTSRGGWTVEWRCMPVRAITVYLHWL